MKLKNEIELTIFILNRNEQIIEQLDPNETKEFYDYDSFIFLKVNEKIYKRYGDIPTYGFIRCIGGEYVITYQNREIVTRFSK